MGVFRQETAKIVNSLYGSNMFQLAPSLYAAGVHPKLPSNAPTRSVDLRAVMHVLTVPSGLWDAHHATICELSELDQGLSLPERKLGVDQKILYMGPLVGNHKDDVCQLGKATQGQLGASGSQLPI